MCSGTLVGPPKALTLEARLEVDAPLYTMDVFALIAIAGVLALDDRAGWQSLAARPVFAGAIVGWVVGRLDAALTVGVVLELVWLTITPMRGTRQPDGIAGAVVGAGTTCTLLERTGDVRVALLASVGVFLGLVVGEASAILSTRLDRVRQRRLGRFAPHDSERAGATLRKLGRYQAVSLSYLFATEALIVAVALPVCLVAGDWFTGAIGGPWPKGFAWWLQVLPVLGVAAVVHHYWQRHLNRFLVVAIVVAWVVLWIR